MTTRPPVDRSRFQVFSASIGGIGAGGGASTGCSAGVCAASAPAMRRPDRPATSDLRRILLLTPIPDERLILKRHSTRLKRDQLPLRPIFSTRAATSAATAGVTNLPM